MGKPGTRSLVVRTIDREFRQPLQKQQSSTTLPGLPPQRWCDAGAQRASAVSSGRHKVVRTSELPAQPADERSGDGR